MIHLFVHYGGYPKSLPCTLPCNEVIHSEELSLSSPLCEIHLMPDDIYNENEKEKMFPESFTITPQELKTAYKYKLTLSSEKDKIGCVGIKNPQNFLPIKLIDREKGTAITPKTTFSSKRGKIEIDLYVSCKDLQKLPLDSYVCVLAGEKV